MRLTEIARTWKDAVGTCMYKMSDPCLSARRQNEYLLGGMGINAGEGLAVGFVTYLATGSLSKSILTGALTTYFRGNHAGIVKNRLERKEIAPGF